MPAGRSRRRGLRHQAACVAPGQRAVAQLRLGAVPLGGPSRSARSCPTAAAAPAAVVGAFPGCPSSPPPPACCRLRARDVHLKAVSDTLGGKVEDGKRVLTTPAVSRSGGFAARCRGAGGRQPAHAGSAALRCHRCLPAMLSPSLQHLLQRPAWTCLACRVGSLSIRRASWVLIKHAATTVDETIALGTRPWQLRIQLKGLSAAAGGSHCQRARQRLQGAGRGCACARRRRRCYPQPPWQHELVTCTLDSLHFVWPAVPSF